MIRRRLGRTGLEVSVAGLGAGGGARLGLEDGKSRRHAARLVRRALDLGVNLIDTANGYGTEDVVGEGIRGVPRERVVLSTKHSISRPDRSLIPAAEVLAGLERSLGLLGTDHVDVFHLHGVSPGDYDHAVGAVLPALLREKEKGKLRFIGLTEYAQRDLAHVAAARAVAAGLVDVVMVAFSMLNQNARQAVFPLTRERDVGTMAMFVARNLFGYPARLRRTLRDLADQGRIPEALAAAEAPLAALVEEAGARDAIDLAYRYARDEPGVDTVLFGTGDPAHLEANVASLTAPPLPAPVRAQIDALFGALTGVGIEPGLPRGALVGEEGGG